MDFIKKLFKLFLNEFIAAFIDDILIYSKTTEELAGRLRLVLKTLEHKLSVKIKKCKF